MPVAQDIYKQRFDILQELSKAFVLSDNIVAVGTLLVDLAVDFAHAEKGSLMLLTDRNEFEILASKGLESQFARNYTVGVNEGIASVVKQNLEPILVTDVEQDPRFAKFFRGHHASKSFISCPLTSRGKLLGILNINDKKNGSSFSENDFELMRILANHASVALENTMLLSQLKYKAVELDALNKKLITTDIVKTEFFTRISHELRTPLNSIKGAIYLLQNNANLSGKERTEFQSIVATEVENLISFVETILKTLHLEDESKVIKRSAVRLEDIFKELKASRSLTSLLSRNGIQLTIEHGVDNIKVLGDRIKLIQLFINLVDGLAHYLDRGDSIAISTEENDEIEVHFAVSRGIPGDVVSTLGDTNYLFGMESPESQLKLYLTKNIVHAHNWRLSTQNTGSGGRITLHIPTNVKEAVDTYVDLSMDAFVEFISELLRLDICSIMMNDESTSELTIKSAVGLEDEIIKKTRIKPGDKIAGWVALEGKPLLIEDIEHDPRFTKKNITQYSTNSLMSLPLKMGNRVVGVLNLNNKKNSKPFTQDDFHLANQISEKISHFMEIIYAERYRDEDMKEFLESLSVLLKNGAHGQSGDALLPELQGRIIEHSRSVKKVKSKHQAAK